MEHAHAAPEASPPKPKSGAWKQNQVQCSIDVEPSGGKVTWSISGEKLGCSVDSSGKVNIGEAPGTITVRAGDGTHYDEVTITITAPPKPAGAATPTSETDSGAEPQLAPPQSGPDPSDAPQDTAEAT